MTYLFNIGIPNVYVNIINIFVNRMFKNSLLTFVSVLSHIEWQTVSRGRDGSSSPVFAHPHLALAHTQSNPWPHVTDGTAAVSVLSADPPLLFALRAQINILTDCFVCVLLQISFLFGVSFRFTEMKSPFASHPVSSNVNIVHSHHAFVKTRKPTLTHYVNSRLDSRFSSFPLMPFCFMISSRIPLCIKCFVIFFNWCCFTFLNSVPCLCFYVIL